jgi:hypothetical protein
MEEYVPYSFFPLQLGCEILKERGARVSPRQAIPSQEICICAAALMRPSLDTSGPPPVVPSLMKQTPLSGSPRASAGESWRCSPAYSVCSFCSW